MGKIKKIFTNVRIIVVLIAVLLAVVAIHPNLGAKGAAIRSVVFNSSAADAGIKSPEPDVAPMSREIVLAINNKEIGDLEDYSVVESSLKPNRTINLRTNEKLYKLVTRANESLGLVVYDAPTNNIKKGLDLQGGTRVLMQPEKELDKDELSILLANIKQRINVYGLSDIVVREAGDLSGNQYILIEIPGAKEEEVKELVSKQGKFEAKIGNESVFRGGQDITYVCRSADCAGVDPYYGCGQVEGGQWTCRFRFAISLSPEAAERQAEATKDLEIVSGDGDEYLSSKLELYLDDSKVDELNIGADLKGRAVTDIQISGSGVGTSEGVAIANALDNMKRLQTILITGSLPIRLDVVKTDTISPLFGEAYLKNAIFIGLLAIAAVGLVSFIRYKRVKIAVPMILTSLVEVVLLVGFAAFARNFMTLDLAAIAGIIIVVGTGVDHLIVITDETLRGEVSQIFDWKKRIKNAFFIIMAAYLTTVVAMLPLLFAGAGLLKGFALTTLVGVSIGVFVARPAYASVIEILLKE
ncbi:hypothetical protein KY332_00760 [Candidatus Woesearchaeota archaeon]|nr:hypothetical protein [Candidatus Woesearchaeota archaeon]